MNRKQNKRVKKGQYGYIKEEQRKTILRTIVFFLLSLAIYLTGYISTGTSKNLLTIVAVLGCLPASKSMVNMIMFLRVKECSETAHQTISQAAPACEGLYDMMFTTYEKTFQISHMVNAGRVLCGYTQDNKCDAAKCEAHLSQMLKQNSNKDITVKIFHDLKKYCERLEQINQLEEREENASVIQLLKEISL